jgi:uncharacterized membrane protein YkvA (DUF1232 family)
MDTFIKLFNNFRIAVKLMTDPRVPGMLKAIPVLGLLYVISPIDLLPEAVLGPLGAIDDIGVVILALETFIKMVPQDIVAAYREGVSGDSTYSKAKGDGVVDGEWKEVK